MKHYLAKVEFTYGEEQNIEYRLVRASSVPNAYATVLDIYCNVEGYSGITVVVTETLDEDY